MKPYVSLIIQLLAEGEQQQAEFVRHFQRRIDLLSLRRVALISFASPYAILLVIFDDKNNKSVKRVLK